MIEKIIDPQFTETKPQATPEVVPFGPQNTSTDPISTPIVVNQVQTVTPPPKNTVKSEPEQNKPSVPVNSSPKSADNWGYRIIEKEQGRNIPN